MIKILATFGFEPMRQKGSHLILKKKTESGEIGTVVPMHKELSEGTVRSILKQARISTEAFFKAL